MPPSLKAKLKELEEFQGDPGTDEERRAAAYTLIKRASDITDAVKGTVAEQVFRHRVAQLVEEAREDSPSGKHYWTLMWVLSVAMERFCREHGTQPIVRNSVIPPSARDLPPVPLEGLPSEELRQ